MSAWGRGRPARLGRSRDLSAVIPAQAGIQVFWERERPARIVISRVSGPLRAGRPRSQGVCRSRKGEVE